MTLRTVLQTGIVILSLVLAGNAALAQTMWHVDDDAPPGGDGTPAAGRERSRRVLTGRDGRNTIAACPKCIATRRMQL